ncbi:hypothetical protein ACIGO8_08020 [Streptomyces sp. NPDC053493]|uniref:hypothetical protein n=1 Tax=Streptomyces sp. NPDC053493 TaxID=3365705 RepID=UPI0037CF5842
MLIVYTPAGGEAAHFDLRSIRTAEASIISRALDTTWRKVKELLADDDPEAMRAVAWAVKKRSEPTLRLADFDPLVDELTVRLDKTEVEQWATEAVAAIDEGIAPEAVLIALHPIVDAACDPDFARELILRLAAAPKDPAATADETAGPSGPTEESTPTGASTSDSSPTSSTSQPPS